MFKYAGLELPSPQFEDTRRLNLNNIARSGILAVLKDAGWPTIITYVYRFLLSECSPISTTSNQVESLKSILISTKGTEITWIDHLGVSRDGFLITDEPEFIAGARGLVEVTIELMESL